MRTKKSKFIYRRKYIEHYVINIILYIYKKDPKALIPWNSNETEYSMVEESKWDDCEMKSGIIIAEDQTFFEQSTIQTTIRRIFYFWISAIWIFDFSISHYS